MSAGIVTLIILLGISLSAIYLGNILFLAMIRQINRKRPEEDLFLYPELGYTQSRKILREYRRLYPGGKLPTYMWASFAASLIAMVLVVICVCLAA